MAESDTIRNGNGRGDYLDRLTKFIKEVGFPVAVATAFIVYIWIVGMRTNDYMAKGTAIMERAIGALERLERKIP